MVEVRHAHHESPATPPNADRHVSRRHIGWDAAGGHPSLVPPPPQQLPEPHNAADSATFYKCGRHFPGKQTIQREKKQVFGFRVESSVMRRRRRKRSFEKRGIDSLGETRIL
ncbi:hypothetical protein GQ457_07G021320 [Hibiscus cannabinus]